MAPSIAFIWIRTSASLLMPIEDLAKAQILRILEIHQGVNARISKVELLRGVNRAIFNPKDHISDRRMRIFINQLRTETTAGALICSSLDGGYYMATSTRELDAFLQTEKNRAKSIYTRVRHQEQHASERLRGAQEKLL